MNETYIVNHGGLMRCCLTTLDDEMVRRQQAGEPLMRDGDTLKCVYCHDEYGMICDTQTPDQKLRWHWAKPQADYVKG